MTIIRNEEGAQKARRPTNGLVEAYKFDGRTVVRSTSVGRRIREQVFPRPSGSMLEPSAAFQVARLQNRNRPNPSGSGLAVVDLFSGCGGLTLGAEEATGALGYRPVVEMALDTNEDALSVFVANHSPQSAVADPIELSGCAFFEPSR